MFLQGRCFEMMAFPALLFSSISMDPQICIVNRSTTGTYLCCANYYTNEKGECSSCAPGFYGDFCEYSCPRGTYGDYCGGQCIPKCSFEECDPVEGCTKSNTNELKESLPDATVTKSGIQANILNITSNTTKRLTFDLTFQINFSTLSNTTISATTSSIQDQIISQEKLKNYLLVSLVIVIVCLLLVVIIQLRLRLKYEHGRISKRKYKIYGETNNHRDIEDVYHGNEPYYQEIEQSLEKIDIPDEKNSDSGNKNRELCTDFKDYYLYPISREKKSAETKKDTSFMEKHKSCTKVENVDDLSIKEPFCISAEEMHASAELTHAYKDKNDKIKNSDKNYDRWSSALSDGTIPRKSPKTKHELSDGNNETYLHVVFK